MSINRLSGFIYATAAIIAASLIGSHALFLISDYRATLERAEAATRETAIVLEEYAKRTFETSDLLLEGIATYVQRNGGPKNLNNSRAAHEYLVDLSRKSSAGDFFLVVDVDGRPTALTAAYPAPKADFSDQAWFRAHKDRNASTYIGEALIGRITGEVLFTYTHALRRADGSFGGAVQVALRPAFLNDMANRSAAGQGTVLGIYSEDGRIIARTGLSAQDIGRSVSQSPILGDLRSQREGTYRSISIIDNEPRITSFRRLERWPVVVIASVSERAVFALWWRSFYRSGAVIGLFLVMIGGLTWFGLRLSGREMEARDELARVNGELEHANADLATALDDKITLLKEIHHRVKNNLQVTSSLLQIQARSFEDPQVQQAFQQTQERLRSIGLIHDTLYRSDTSGTVNLSDYFGRLIEELSKLHGEERGVDLRLEAEPIAIDLTRAAPLALAVTEVISNAYKHAFEPGQGGRIDVRVGETDADIEVEVRDNGRGLPDKPHRAEALGQKLIRAFVMQLQGRCEFIEDGGTVFRLRLPKLDTAQPA